MSSTSITKRPRRMARQPKAEIPVGQESNGISPIMAVEEPSAASPNEPNKTAKVLSLLKRPNGTTLDEMVEATGWLRHTTRAALTGLKKKGHKIERTKVEGVSRYAVAETADQ